MAEGVSNDEQSQQWTAALEALRSDSFAEQVLPGYLRSCRWFGGKAQTLRSVKVLDVMPLGSAGRLILLHVQYFEASSESYLLPLQLGAKGRDHEAIVGEFESDDGGGVLVDAVDDENFRAALFEIIFGEKRLCGGSGALVGICGQALKAQPAEIILPLPSRVLRAEQSNSAIIYVERFFLKLYRKPELGQNPEAELLRFFSERQNFPNVPAYCGALEYQRPGAEAQVLALLVANVPNEGAAWTCTLDELGRFYERVQADAAVTPALIGEIVGDGYLERVRQLGVRTAQMHLALAADGEDESFAPEEFTDSNLRSLHQSMRAGTQTMCQLLQQKLAGLSDACRDEAAALLRREDEILHRQAAILERKISATRIRHHGDYHLGQVLNTGRDFVIIDFEGEPARPLSERRLKHSPLRDVAGMLRSFHYAAHTALAQWSADEATRLEKWAEIWVENISASFLEAYLRTANGASFLPKDEKMVRIMIDLFLLEKAIYEVCYELNNRPEWIFIPLRGIARILDDR